MTKQKYEATEVRISTLRWLSGCAFAALFIVVGLLILIESLTSKDLEGAWISGAVGAAIVSIGAYALYKWRRPYELALTERGKAEKAKAEDLAKQRAASRAAAFNGFVWFVAFVAAAIYFPESIIDALEGKVRIYTIECVRDLNSNLSCPADGWKASLVTSYSVYPSQQVVVGAAVDTNVPPFKLFNCAVVDRTNWTCSTEPDIDAPKITLRNGAAANYMSTSTLKFVSRLRWWSVRLQYGSILS
jgi:hypothetical protein